MTSTAGIHPNAGLDCRGMRGTIQGGGAPVRGLAAVGHCGVAFASVSNDGVLRAWSLQGALLSQAQVSGIFFLMQTGFKAVAGEAKHEDIKVQSGVGVHSSRT